MERTPPEQTEYRRLIVGNVDIDLVQVLLEIATDSCPDLDFTAYRLEIVRLSECAAKAVREVSGLRPRLQALSRFLYDVEGFRGNRAEYYDPRNSYLNEVLDRRTGIPITLGIVYMAVAARIGIPMYGVCAPGHFVLGTTLGEETWHVDPFSGGDVLDAEQCERRIRRELGEDVPIPASAFLPALPAQIVTRVLRNLKTALCMTDDWARLLDVQKRLTLLLPDVADEQRDLGLIYLRNGYGSRASEILQQHVRACTPAEAKALQPYLGAARRLAAEAN